MGGQNPRNTVNLPEQIYAPNGGYCVFILQHLRNKKHVPCFYWVIETWVEVWENEKCCGNTSCSRVFPQLFRVLPNFHNPIGCCALAKNCDWLRQITPLSNLTQVSLLVEWIETYSKARIELQNLQFKSSCFQFLLENITTRKWKTTC